MANNYGPLQSDGPITVPNIADVFFLYKPYSGGQTQLSDYYADKIKVYAPPTPTIPSTGSPISVGNFYGKRYALPVNVYVNSPVKNFDLYTAANSVALNTYNVSLANPDIPFIIVLYNNSTISSDDYTKPALYCGSNIAGNLSVNSRSSLSVVNNGSIIGGVAPGGARSDTYGPGSRNWTVPAGVTSVTVHVVGGGGGGGTAQEVLNGGAGGGGGSGGYGASTFSVTPGDNLGINVGGGGGGGQTSGRGSVANGGGGGSSNITRNGAVMAYGNGGGGGGGGQSGNGGNGGGGGGGSTRGGNGGGRGNSGTNDRSSGFGGGGGGSVYGGWGGGGGGASFFDRTNPLGWSGSGGGGGGANVSYTIALPGGDAILLTKPTSINNVGVISGGLNSIGTAGPYGNAIRGKSFLTNSPLAGTVRGGLV